MARIRPGVPAPSLAPLMGREVVREQQGVRYKELESKNLLNRCVSTRVPFDWTVNPYRGCAMGCRYCYAAYTHEFMGIATPEEFHSTVFIKRGGDEGTAKRLAAAVRRGERIALGTATDPYQPGEAREAVTRRFLTLAARHRGARLGITTKGALILRDVDLLRRIHARSSLSVQISLVSPDAGLLRRLEPWAPPPEARIEVMRRLAEAGLAVALFVAPVLPGLTDRTEDLDRLIGLAAAAGVTRMGWNVLFLRSPTKEKYLRWLESEFPRLLPAYHRAYDRSVYLRGPYRERLRDVFVRLRTKHGLTDPPGFGPDGPAQLRLWA